ncbi:hypothetical protein KM043_017444 [Ampulex compressa]|nr:hypothetical protein KM043_017444 [Ampulex compressa]
MGVSTVVVLRCVKIGRKMKRTNEGTFPFIYAPNPAPPSGRAKRAGILRNKSTRICSESNGRISLGEARGEVASGVLASYAIPRPRHPRNLPRKTPEIVFGLSAMRLCCSTLLKSPSGYLPKENICKLPGGWEEEEAGRGRDYF